MKITFKRNMSNPDRAVRTMVGLTLFTVGPVMQLITPDRLSNVLMGVVATLALVSAFLSYCFLYEITGFGTGRK